MGACLMLSFNTYSGKKPLGIRNYNRRRDNRNCDIRRDVFVLIIDFYYSDWPWCTGDSGDVGHPAVDIEGEGHPAIVDIEGEIVHPAMDGEANADVDI